MDHTRRMGTLGALALAVYAAMLSARMVRRAARLGVRGGGALSGSMRSWHAGSLVSEERTMTWLPYLQLAMSILTMVLLCLAVRWETRK